MELGVKGVVCIWGKEVLVTKTRESGSIRFGSVPDMQHSIWQRQTVDLNHPQCTLMAPYGL